MLAQQTRADSNRRIATSSRVFSSKGLPPFKSSVIADSQLHGVISANCLVLPTVSASRQAGVNNISYMQHKDEAHFSTFIQS